jgi:Zn finger protein HypA/HybF involved in hydrogenase expression
MKIVEVTCQDCKAVYETLDSVPKDAIQCPGCGSKKLKFETTEKEFKGCGGGCDTCDSCD